MIRISVCGVNIQGGAYFLARRKPGGTQGGRWEFPGGKVEKEENPTTALVREFEEELGVVVTVGEQLAETSFLHREEQYILFAYQVEIPKVPWVLREHEEAGWFTPQQIQTMDLSESDGCIFRLISSKIK